MVLADLVSRLGVATIKGLQNGGIIPVAKHFPGHGDTSVDSMWVCLIVNHDWTLCFELRLFRQP